MARMVGIHMNPTHFPPGQPASSQATPKRSALAKSRVLYVTTAAHCAATASSNTMSSLGSRSIGRQWRRLRARARITSPFRPPMYPVWRRCSSVEYCLYAPSSRLASRAPRRPKRGSYLCADPKQPCRRPLQTVVSRLNSRPFRDERAPLSPPNVEPFQSFSGQRLTNHGALRGRNPNRSATQAYEPLGRSLPVRTPLRRARDRRTLRAIRVESQSVAPCHRRTVR